ATLAATFAAYLAHPTWATWPVYYFEITPILVFLGALGVSGVMRILAGEWKRWRLPEAAQMPRAAIAVLVFCTLLAPALLANAGELRRWFLSSTRERYEFETAGDRVRALRASSLTAPEPHGQSRRLAARAGLDRVRDGASGQREADQARARPAPVHIRRSDGALPRGAALNERSEVVSNTAC